MTEAVSIDNSETSDLAKIQGKECVVGRFITSEEGWDILKVADTWVGTPYVMVGSASEKGIKGDCSGTTNKIFSESGFPYPYQMTSSFIDFSNKTNRFREIDVTKESLQAADILWWPGHMAIYAPFPEGHPRRNSGLVKGGKPKVNNMYTAFNSRTSTPYGPYNIEAFRGDKYRVFRYFLKPGEPKCK